MRVGHQENFRRPVLCVRTPPAAGVYRTTRYDDSSGGVFGSNGAVVSSEGWRLCGTPRTDPHTPILNPNGVIDSQSHTYRSSSKRGRESIPTEKRGHSTPVRLYDCCIEGSVVRGAAKGRNRVIGPPVGQGSEWLDDGVGRAMRSRKRRGLSDRYDSVTNVRFCFLTWPVSPGGR